MEKAERYNLCYNQIEALVQDETDQTAGMANAAAILHSAFGFWWTGFYIVKGDELVLGPFQGPVACTRIAFGRGVCGSAWQRAESIVVPNVEQFPGHIACSSESRSEIVVPLFSPESGKVTAVLDIDSCEIGTFDEVDREWLEKIASLVAGIGKRKALAPDAKGRLAQIVEFCKLIDREKFIQRHTYLTDGVRFENDAEHAWHMAVMTLLLSQYANENVEVLKVVSILLIHDLVEIYAGDTFAYDEEGKKSQRQRELAAAERLYAQLPEELGLKLRSLWDEFEAGETPEAKFAHTMDNFQPLMLQSATNGKAWKEGGRRLSEVLERNARSADGSQSLWDYALENFIRPEIESGNLIDDTK